MANRKIIYRRRRFWQSSWEKVLFLVVLGIFFLFIPGNQELVAQKPAVQQTFFPVGPKTIPFPIPIPAQYPQNTTGIYPGEEVTAEGVVVMDVASGVFLYRRNENEQLLPASTTKLMTALVALDSYKLDDIVTIMIASRSGQLMGLFDGEQMTVENLLYGLLIHSGNDAAFALADHYRGGRYAFMQAMNKKATDLHLTGTHYTNPAGFDDLEHKMTPLDLARLGSAAIQNNTIAKMVAIPQITISDATHTYYHELKNVNQLLGKIPGVNGIKTGWTEEAGENLITSVVRNNHDIIIVILQSRDRFQDTTKLIDWVFTNYKWETF